MSLATLSVGRFAGLGRGRAEDAFPDHAQTPKLSP
jgi:hypothetical protein